MLVRVWRFTTLIFASLLTGLAFCHVLELPAKRQYPAALYLELHRTLYVAFGPPNVGAIVTLGAVLLSFVLVVLVRRQPGFWPTLVGAACLALGLAAYFAQVEPANAAMRMMSLSAPPQDWTSWRDQWEYGHALCFALDLAGLCALTWAALAAPRRVAPPLPDRRDHPARRMSMA